MKFHSNLKTVAIAILVLLLFIFTSVFILAELNLTSPTLLVTSRVFKELENKESDFGFSFSSMERNFGDRVKLNNLRVSYKDSEIAYFENVEVKAGILDLASYFLLGNITPEIIVSDGEIVISEELLSFLGKGQGENQKENSIKDEGKYKVDASLSSVNLIVEGWGELENISASLSYGGSIDSFSFSFHLPLLEFDYLDYSFLAESIDGELESGKEKSIFLKTNSLSLKGKSLEAAVHDFNAEIDFPSFSLISFDTIRGDFGISLVRLSYSGYEGEVERVRGTIEKDYSTLTASSLTINSEEADCRLSSLSFNLTDLNSLSGEIGALRGTALGFDFLASGFKLNELRIDDRRGDIALSSFAFTDIRSISFDQIRRAELKDIGVNFSLSDKIDIAFELSSLFGTESDLLSDIEIGLRGGLVFEDNSLSYYSLDSDSLFLGIGERGDNHFRAEGNLDNTSISFHYGETELNLDLSLKEKRVKGGLKGENYLLSSVLPFFGDDGSKAEKYISPDSSLSFDLGFDFVFSQGEFVPISGPLSYSLFINQLQYGSLKSSISSEGSIRLNEENLDISLLKIATDYFSFSTEGTLDFKTLLPQLVFSAETEKLGKILEGEMILKESNEYTYSISLPSFADSGLWGNLVFSDTELRGSSMLRLDGESRPFDFSYLIDEKSFTLSSEHIDGAIDFSHGFNALIDVSSLDLVKNDKGEAIYLDGNLVINSSEENLLSFSAERLTIGNLWLIPTSPNIVFSLQGDSDNVYVSNILIEKEGEVYFTGEANYKRDNRAITLTLDEREGRGDIILSFFKDEMYSGLIRVRDLDLSSFGAPDLFCNINLTGRTSRIEDFTLEGNIEVSALDSVNDDRVISADLVLDNDSLLLDNIRFTSTGFYLTLGSMMWDSSEGVLSIDKGVISMDGEHLDRNYPFLAEFSLTMNAEKNDNIYYSIYNIIRDGGEGVTLDLTLDKLDLDNSRILVEDKYTHADLSGRTAVFTGSLLEGEFNFDDLSFDLSLHAMPLADIDFSGSIKGELYANATINQFNMYLINMFMISPLITFDADFVSGEAGITSSDGTYMINGNVSAEELGVGIFWIPDQKVYMHNPRFDMWNNELRCSVSKATVIDYETYERKTIDMYAGMTLTPMLNIEGYDAEIWIDENNPLRIRLPLPSSNIDILANGYGHYYMKTTEGEPMINDGEFTLLDSVVSIGMNPYPDWYVLEGESNFNLKMNFLRNNQLVYPAGNNPILTITLDENSTLSAYYDRDNISILGDIYIRGGEIYYFQKYFYITEGSISFPDPEKFDPKINLRATLRDYDSESNRVEINLVMKDNTFENLSPTLESVPAKDISEIMEILGQSILPSSSYDSVSVGSVTSLITEGIDILGKLGIVTIPNPVSGLTSSLKQVFGVDSFSLHSNIMNNFITDTLASSLGSGLSSYSPMARYLDGTTLTIGKYLSSDFYLQGMVHLVASNNPRDRYTFISDDLVLDTEFSLEWMNPAFKITFFTSPNYFSFYSIFETFKFSISKTINW